jgi:hypothetical protein
MWQNDRTSVLVLPTLTTRRGVVFDDVSSASEHEHQPGTDLSLAALTLRVAKPYREAD